MFDNINVTETAKLVVACNDKGKRPSDNGGDIKLQSILARMHTESIILKSGLYLCSTLPQVFWGISEN